MPPQWTFSDSVPLEERRRTMYRVPWKSRIAKTEEIEVELTTGTHPAVRWAVRTPLLTSDILLAEDSVNE